MTEHDLISRSALRKLYSGWIPQLELPADERDKKAIGICIVALDEAPTIDPESLRPKGRWELYGNDDDCGCSYFCSNCHRSYPEEWFWDHGKYVPFENCPHCTAKMEG